MAKTKVENRLAEIRKGRGIGASDLARRVNVSRQTIYAIEIGTYVPNTQVALHLARELERIPFGPSDDAVAGVERRRHDVHHAQLSHLGLNRAGARRRPALTSRGCR